MIRNRVLVTGANGFVGRHLCTHLAAIGRQVTACVRHPEGLEGVQSEHIETAEVPDLTTYEDWPDLLADVDAIVHLAARVHVMHDRSSDPLAEFRRVNVATTSTLADQAARAGVRRFIYVSSIKVNGEETTSGEFHADDLPGYRDPYGQSKWEAEQRVEDIGAASGLEWVVIRPTLVFGPGVRGNFLSLMRCIHRGLPIPLGSVRNQRSLVSVYNLADLIATAIDHPAAAGQRFLVKDPEDLSTRELICRIAKGLQCRPRLLSVHSALLVRSAELFGQRDKIQRLIGSLVVNTDKTAALLQWNAPKSLDSALADTCAWFKSTSPIKGVR
jgi:nucleoside-diphosphate-sugar epimerase